MTLDELRAAEREAHGRYMYHEAAERGYDAKAARHASDEWRKAKRRVALAGVDGIDLWVKLVSAVEELAARFEDVDLSQLGEEDKASLRTKGGNFLNRKLGRAA